MPWFCLGLENSVRAVKNALLGLSNPKFSSHIFMTCMLNESSYLKLNAVSRYTKFSRTRLELINGKKKNIRSSLNLRTIKGFDYFLMSIFLSSLATVSRINVINAWGKEVSHWKWIVLLNLDRNIGDLIQLSPTSMLPAGIVEFH